MSVVCVNVDENATITVVLETSLCVNVDENATITVVLETSICGVDDVAVPKRNL